MSVDKRFFFVSLIAGSIGGVMFANFLIPALVSNNVAGLGNLAGFINRPETVINKIEKETLVVPEADYFDNCFRPINKAG